MAPGFAFPPPPPPPPKQDISSSDGSSRGGTRRGGSSGRGDRGTVRGGPGVGRGQYISHSSSNEQASSAYAWPTHSSDVYAQQTGTGLTSAPDTNPAGQHGQKRKRDAPPNANRSWRAGHVSGSRSHPMKKALTAPAIDIAPSVPSFGAALPLSLPPISVSESVARSAPSRVGLFGAGLSGNDIDLLNGQAGDSLDSESEDDEDEERTLSTALGISDVLRFEHNGEFIALETPADLKAWQKERRQKWPTMHRAELKARERNVRIAERLRIEADTYRLLYGSSPPPPMQRPARTFGTTTAAANTSRADELRAQLLQQKMLRTRASSDSNIRDSPVSSHHEPNEAGEAVRRGAQPDVTTSNIIPGIDTYGDDDSESSESKESDGEADSKSEASSSSGPEVQTTKPVSDQPNGRSSLSNRACEFFSRSGHCKFGDRCRYQHIQPELDSMTLMPRIPKQDKQGSWKHREKSQRKTLHQMLIDQEQEAENKLALQAIKHLGSIGFLKPTAMAPPSGNR